MGNIVLVGNPNVGKSVVFNALTGSYVTVSNYPGTTVTVSKGVGRFRGQKFTVIDTPGVNGLRANSEDERVTIDILSKSSITCVVQVADSKNLKRALMLTLEMLGLKVPLVLNLNMSDEARDRGIKIDVKKLSQRLGIEVIETVAITGEGMARLKEAIAHPKIPHLNIEGLDMAETVAKTGDEIYLLKKRAYIVDRLAKEALYTPRMLRKNISDMIGRITMKPFTGIPILTLILVLMYMFVGRFAAGQAVDFFKDILFERYINHFLINVIDRYIHIGVVKEFLVGEYGVITMALTYAFAIIFPIVTAFFLFFGVLEDSGYLPRLTILSDRVFKGIGLNGRAVLPLVLGLGCGTMATLTARILDTKKERILVSLLLSLVIPCSAQLGVIMGMLGSLSAKAVAIWLGVMLFVMITTGFLASKIIPGTRSPFIQEVPPIRMPQIKNIAIKTLARLKWYLKEAVPLFILGTTILFLSDKTGLLEWIKHALNPLVVTLLNLPAKATEAFIVGFLRRDYGAAGLYMLSRAGELDKIQVLVSIVVITLFVPCIAQFFVMVKERGTRAAFAIGAFVFIFAFLVGGVLNFALRYLMSKGVAVI